MKTISKFDEKVAMNAVLYIVEQMGGKVDMHKIFKTLYFADREHLSKYGRRITGDFYIKMKYGPVPSKIDDIFKAVRGDSFFSGEAFKHYFHFINQYVIESNTKCDTDYLSQTDIECLDIAIGMCRDKNFNELTEFSHDLAWFGAADGKPMSFGDMMREVNEDEDYAKYIQYSMEYEDALCL